MLIGFVSDPHANLPALERVLAEVDRAGCDLLVCVGDFVGYGPHPNEVVEAIRERTDLDLAGNHDVTALGKPGASIDVMNPVAAEAIRWTRSEMTDSTIAFLEGLGSRSKIDGLEVAHASFRDPIWEYVFSKEVAAENFREEDFALGVVGHTHVPAVYTWAGETAEGGPVTVGSDGRAEIPVTAPRALLNPGGVGQPRDGDPRASWATWDTERLTFTVRRLEYPVGSVQEDILRAGLPPFLASRLSQGI